MSAETEARLTSAIADAMRGHRPHEWERVASDLVAAITAYRSAAPKGLKQMQDEVTAWCERKGWKGEGSAPVTFGDTMALLHSEVSEALEAYRDWGTADATATHSPSSHSPVCRWRLWAEDQLREGMIEEACDCEFGEGAKPEGIGSEFADVLIRLLDDCDRWGVDLAFEYERKMAYNEKRPYQHGGRAL